MAYPRRPRQRRVTVGRPGAARRSVRGRASRWSRSPSTTAPPTSPTSRCRCSSSTGCRSTLYVATDFVERQRGVPRRRRAAVVDGAARRGRDRARRRRFAHPHARAARPAARGPRSTASSTGRSSSSASALGVTPGALRLSEGGDGIAGRRRRGPRRASARPRVAGTRVNRYGGPIPYRLARSPVQLQRRRCAGSGARSPAAWASRTRSAGCSTAAATRAHDRR